MKSLLLAFLSPLLIINSTAAQTTHDLIGYWHNWNDASAPYISLDQLPPAYSVVDIAFAIPEAGTDYKMTFTPDQVAPAVLLSQIQNLQAAGRKVLISIGGATAPVALSNITERDTFVSTMTSIINYYGFDGMDIDLEGSSLALSGGTISQPVDAPIIHLIDAVQQIMTNYRTTFNRKMMLTMAPEAAYVQGGMSAYGGIWGAYLPVIDALRDSLDILHVQLYNTGSMYGIDGNIYTQGTVDFIVSMTEAVIQGFNTTGGAFAGLPESKVAVGLPACPLAAGGGFTDTAIVKDAMDYLLGNGPQPGTYVMAQPAGYPQLRGMMTWSVNWDAVNTCYNSYSFVANYNLIFFGSTGVAMTENLPFNVYPNPAQDMIRIQSGIPFSEGTTISVLDIQGNVIISSKAELGNYVHELGTSLLAKGMYLIKIETPAAVRVMRMTKL